MTITTRPTKKNGYSSGKLQAKRDRKRQEAEARQREWESKSLQERIEICHGRRGASRREVAKLSAKIVECYKVATGAVKTVQYSEPILPGILKLVKEVLK
jgi:hypothetical protein